MKKALIILAILIIVIITDVVIMKRHAVAPSVQPTITAPTAVATPTETPSAAPEQLQESGDDVNGQHIGYIKNLTDTDGAYSMTINYVQWTSCKNCPDDYSLTNTNTKLRTFPIAANAAVLLQTYSHGATNGNFNWNQMVSLSDFAAIFAHPMNDYTATRLLYWITIKNGTVTNIVEQYQP